MRAKYKDITYFRHLFETRGAFIHYLDGTLPRFDEYDLLDTCVNAAVESNDGVVFFAYDQGFTTVLSYCNDVLKNNRAYCLATAIGFCFHQKEYLECKQ